MAQKYRLGIDAGGTFTDFILSRPDGDVQIAWECLDVARVILERQSSTYSKQLSNVSQNFARIHTRLFWFFISYHYFFGK